MSDDDVSWDMGDPALASDERRVLEGLRGALQGPASSSELAGFEVTREVYRHERDAQAHLLAGGTAIASARRKWGISPFLPAGTALTVCLLLPTGTAVAAYTGRLPAPVQGWAHTALGRVGVPAHQRTAKHQADRVVRTPDIDSPGPQSRDSHVVLGRRSAQPCPMIVPRQPGTGHRTLPSANLGHGKGDRGACGPIVPNVRRDGASKQSPTTLPGPKFAIPAPPRPVSPSSGARPAPKPTPTPSVPIRASPRRR